MNTPTNFNIEQLKTEPSVKLTWDPIEEATYYIISRKELNSDTDFEVISKTKKLFYFDRKLKYNESYNYKLRAVFDENIIEYGFETESEIKLSTTELITSNFYNEGIKESSIMQVYPFNELELVDSNLKPTKLINEHTYLKIPKFYLQIDYETKQLKASKIMINEEYDLHYSFIVDDEIKDYIYVPCFALEEVNNLELIRTELKENEVLFDISILNLIQTLWILYFQTSDPQVLTKLKPNTKTQLTNLEFNTFDSKEYNSFLGLINLINVDSLFIDGIILQNQMIKMSINPLENNNKGFKYEEYEELTINKSNWIKKFDLDYFMFEELSEEEQKHYIKIETGEILYLNLNPKSLFDYDFKTLKNTNKSKIRKCLYSD